MTWCPRAFSSAPVDPCVNPLAWANCNMSRSFNFAYDGDSCSVEVDAQRRPSVTRGKENGQGNSARSTEVRDAPFASFALALSPMSLEAICIRASVSLMARHVLSFAFLSTLLQLSSPRAFL